MADEDDVEYVRLDQYGYRGYRVGSDGSVWSCLKQVGRGAGGGTYYVVGDTWKKLKPYINTRGYPVVSLSKNGKQSPVSVHSLVLLGFIGPCPEGKECAHENGIRSDSRLSNLSYKTGAENQADRIRHGYQRGGSRRSQVNRRQSSGHKTGVRCWSYRQSKACCKVWRIKENGAQHYPCSHMEAC